MSDDMPMDGFETRAIHAGTPPDPTTGARVAPIYQTASYVFRDAGHAADLFALRDVGFIYSRLTNPTVSALEAKIAAMENGAGATCTASGHSAMIMTLFALMQPGDNLIASRKLYGGTLNQFANSLPRAFNWQTKFVDLDNPDSFKAAIDDKTKAIVIESLANPGGVVADIDAIAKVASDAGIPLIVDNTMASPYLVRPIDHGATLVIHSTTKFLSGHGNAIGGVVVDCGTFDWAAGGKFPALVEPEPGYHGLKFYETFGPMAFTIYAHAIGLRDLGPSMAPMNAFLTIAGIETLALRMERHCQNAQAVAEFLDAHPAVDWVNYAGLASSPYNGLAEKYLPNGAGAVFTFGLKGGYEAGVAMVNSMKLFSHLANIGDTRSLIIHPASTTHSQLSPEELGQAGAGPEVIRLSVGLESLQDILADLEQGLQTASSVGAQAAE